MESALSILIVTETELGKLQPFVAEQVRVVPAVSDVRFVVPQPVEEAMPDCGSVTLHATVTAPLYQPLTPSVPVTIGVITGGVVSIESGGVMATPKGVPPTPTVATTALLAASITETEWESEFVT